MAHTLFSCTKLIGWVEDVSCSPPISSTSAWTRSSYFPNPWPSSLKASWIAKFGLSGNGGPTRASPLDVVDLGESLETWDLLDFLDPHDSTSESASWPSWTPTTPRVACTTSKILELKQRVHMINTTPRKIDHLNYHIRSGLFITNWY